MIVRVLHPVKLRYLTPRGGERVDHIRRETEVEIPEIAASEFQPVPVRLADCTCHRRDDGLWIDMRHGLGARGLAPADFAAWLSGEPVDRELDAVLTPRLRRTALVVGVDPGIRREDRHPLSIRATPGMRDAIPRHREIVHDTGGQAEAAVRVLLREGFALVEGRLRMRVRPLATLSRPPDGSVARLDLFAFGNPYPSMAEVADPIRYREVAREIGCRNVPSPDASLAEFCRLLPDWDGGADARRWIATTRAASMDFGMRHLAHVDPTFRTLADEAMRLRDLATIGAFPDAEVEQALDVLRRSAEAIGAHPDIYRFKGRDVVDHARDLLAHPLAQPALAAADADFLQGLAP
jgi:hypothetical protein